MFSTTNTAFSHPSSGKIFKMTNTQNLEKEFIFQKYKNSEQVLQITKRNQDQGSSKIEEEEIVEEPPLSQTANWA